jgi:hypothetical protein
MISSSKCRPQNSASRFLVKVHLTRSARAACNRAVLSSFSHSLHKRTRFPRMSQAVTPPHHSEGGRIDDWTESRGWIRSRESSSFDNQDLIGAKDPSSGSKSWPALTTVMEPTGIRLCKDSR